MVRGAMGRPRAFDRDTALVRAMDVFWARGYESTSIAELLVAMGIQRFSMYATFGSKSELFLAALKLYRRRWSAVIAEHLATDDGRPGAARATLIGLLRAIGREAADDRLGRGCMIANAAVELRSLDAEAAAIVHASLGSLESTFADLLRRAAADGQLADGRDPHQLAAFLIAAMNGIRDVVRAGGDRRRVHDLVETLISIL